MNSTNQLFVCRKNKTLLHMTLLCYRTDRNNGAKSTYK